MPESCLTHRIGIVVYPDAQRSAVSGLGEMLQLAHRLAREHGAPPTELSIQELDIRLLPPAPTLPFTAVILPPSLGDKLPSDANGQLVPWLARCHTEGTLLCSVCAGAFLLADTGLLAGRDATTHWALAEIFAQQYPLVNLKTEKLLIDDGDIITAGGLMAWVDLGLRLVERLMGPAIMLTTARYFLVDPGGREQRFYMVFSPNLTHGDQAVLKAQHWLQTRYSKKITTPQMAVAAELGERTFLRRFHKATGLKPVQYLQYLRVGKAREKLELTIETVEEIGWAVGYEDTSAFRRVFHRIMGLSPGEYRRRFGVGHF